MFRNDVKLSNGVCYYMLENKLERPDSPEFVEVDGSEQQRKRARREIANNTERKRMQGINAGFQSLLDLLPHLEGEKLSKAAILQQSAEYLYQLQQEHSRLQSQNYQLQQVINQDEGESGSVCKKRRTDSITVSGAETVKDETAAEASSTLLGVDQAAINSELMEVREQLGRERGLRLILETQVRVLETQLYSEHLKNVLVVPETSKRE